MLPGFIIPLLGCPDGQPASLLGGGTFHDTIPNSGMACISRRFSEVPRHPAKLPPQAVRAPTVDGVGVILTLTLCAFCHHPHHHSPLWPLLRCQLNLLYRCPADSLLRCPTAPLPLSPTAALPLSPAAILPRCLTAPLPR